MKNAVVLFAESHRIQQFWVALLSLLEHRRAPTSYDVVVIALSIDACEIESIRGLGSLSCPITVIDCAHDKVYADLRQENEKLLAGNVARYGVARVLSGYDRILQVESQVIFNGEIDSLFGLDVESNYLAALPDMLGARSRPKALRKYGIGNHPFYFDATVMLLNAERIRSLHMWRKLLGAHASNAATAVRDVVYNVVLGPNVVPLPVEANYPCALETVYPLSYVEGFFDREFPSDRRKRWAAASILSYKGCAPQDVGGELRERYLALLTRVPERSLVSRTLPEPRGSFSVLNADHRPTLSRLEAFIRSGVNGCANQTTESSVVVSLTTIPARIESVALTIYQLLHQTRKPNRVCLWLAKEQFPAGEAALPEQLKALTGNGLEICWADENLGPHTKYYFSMCESPDSIVITVDDDVVYPRDLVEVLMEGHDAHPNAVCALRTHLVTFGPSGEILPYRQWTMECSRFIGEPLHSLCATGVGGVLYPPHLLPEELFNREAIRTLAFKADDIWLKFMEVVNNIPVVQVRPCVELDFFANTQAVGLLHQNITGGGNDRVIATVLEKYDELPGGDTVTARMRRDQQPRNPIRLPQPEWAVPDMRWTQIPRRSLHVCFICDNGYIVPTTVAITSLLENKKASTYVCLYIVAADLSDDNARHFMRFEASDVRVTILKSSSIELQKLHAYSAKAMCVASPAALLKFSLGKLLPHLDKVLYLDGDIIVCRDLMELYSLNLGADLVAAVPDSGKMYSKRPILHSVKVYFNSGVMLLNLAEMRRGGYAERLLDAKRRSSDMSLMDQNVFNQVFNGRVRALPIRYNCLFLNLIRAYAAKKFSFARLGKMYGVHYRNFSELQEGASILHFASKEKPWKYDRIPLGDLWDSYFRMSFCAGRRLDRVHADGALATFQFRNWFDEDSAVAARQVELLRREVRELHCSFAYRVGMFVTWPARRVYRGLRCWKENGLMYTIRRLLLGKGKGKAK